MRDCMDTYHATTRGGFCSRCGKTWKKRHLCQERQHDGSFAWSSKGLPPPPNAPSKASSTGGER